MKPKIKEGFHTRSDRLEQKNQHNSGGKGKEISDVAETACIGLKNIIGE